MSTSKTVTLTLTVDVYNGSSEDDTLKSSLKTSLLGSLNNTGHDVVETCMEHFVNSVFYPEHQHSDYDKKELNALAPTLFNHYTANPEVNNAQETFCNFENVSWRLTSSTVLASDIVIGIEHKGYLMFDVELPDSIDSRTFITEFNKLYRWYSETCVEWGWMDSGFILDSPRMTLA